MKQVPFFANTADDTHCVQAAFRMMLKYFLPERDFSWAELDKMTHKAANKGTWWFPMLLEVEKLGLKTKLIENFDYKRYLDEGNSYVKGIYSPEVAEYHLNKTNLTEVRQLIPEFLRQSDFKTRPATVNDLDKLLADGWLVGLAVNSRVLNDRPGYSGHVVLVYAKNAQNYVLHDPGLPPKKALSVDRNLLLKAMNHAGKNNAALIAVGH